MQQPTACACPVCLSVHAFGCQLIEHRGSSLAAMPRRAARTGAHIHRRQRQQAQRSQPSVDLTCGGKRSLCSSYSLSFSRLAGSCAPSCNSTGLPDSSISVRQLRCCRPAGRYSGCSSHDSSSTRSAVRLGSQLQTMPSSGTSTNCKQVREEPGPPQAARQSDSRNAASTACAAVRL